MKHHIDIRNSIVVAVATFALGLPACSSAPAPEAPKTPEPQEELPEPEPDPGEAEPEEIESNKDCIKGMAKCGGGMCTVDVTNSCDAPATCELQISAVCQGATTAGEAVGKGRNTVAAGKTDVIEAGANCEGSAAVATQVKSLNCR